MTLFQFIYYLKPWAQILLCAAGWTVWTVMMILLYRCGKIRICLAVIGAALALALILYQTVFRGSTERRLILQPFAILLKAIRDNSEYYRSIALNAILFTPLGFTSSTLLSQRFAAGRSVLYSVLIGLLLSAAVETAQYVFALGIAETDDLIMNAVGVFVGAAHIWIVCWAEKKLRARAQRIDAGQKGTTI